MKMLHKPGCHKVYCHWLNYINKPKQKRLHILPLFLTLLVITKFVTLELAIPSFKFWYYSLEHILSYAIQNTCYASVAWWVQNMWQCLRLCDDIFTRFFCEGVSRRLEHILVHSLWIIVWVFGIACNMLPLWHDSGCGIKQLWNIGNSYLRVYL